MFVYKHLMGAFTRHLSIYGWVMAAFGPCDKSVVPDMRDTGGPECGGRTRLEDQAGGPDWRCQAGGARLEVLG